MLLKYFPCGLIIFHLMSWVLILNMAAFISVRFACLYTCSLKHNVNFLFQSMGIHRKSSCFASRQSLISHSSCVLYLIGLGCVKDVHSARLYTIGFGPPVQRKSAFPSTPISIRQRAIVPVTEGGWGEGWEQQTLWFLLMKKQTGYVDVQMCLIRFWGKLLAII